MSAGVWGRRPTEAEPDSFDSWDTGPNLPEDGRPSLTQGERYDKAIAACVPELLTYAELEELQHDFSGFWQRLPSYRENNLLRALYSNGLLSSDLIDPVRRRVAHVDG